MNKEPAAIVSLIMAIIGVAVAFGLKLNDAQQAAIYTVVTLAGGLFIRSQVVPVAKVTDAGLNPVTMEPGPTTGEPENKG